MQGLMYYVSGRHFDVTYMNDEDGNRVFNNQDWNTYVPEEQLIFKGDTLYLCVF